MSVKIHQKEISFVKGKTYAALAKEMQIDAMGVLRGGETLPLSTEMTDGDDVSFILYTDEEGRRIYERSLRFIFLIAMREVLPFCRVRIENSTAAGFYAYFPERKSEITSDLVQKIEAAMRRIVAEDIPFVPRSVPKEEAIRIYEREGDLDKVQLMRYRKNERFPMYACGASCMYFYGEMLPSTGYCKVFSVRTHIPGMEIALPDPENPSVPEKQQDERHLMHTFAESAKWAKILNCDNVSDLNEMTEKGAMREFIRVNEALQEKKINEIAEKFRLSGARLILIAGPSSSGKTTFANRLNVALRVLGYHPKKVSMDDYYRNRDTTPLGIDGKPDYERPDILDIPLFNEHLASLLQGQEIAMPTYDFVLGRRSDNATPLQIGENEPLIVEGIHALNEEFSSSVPREQKFKIYISALTTLNMDDHNRLHTTDMRLLRRMVRDHNFRGYSPMQTMEGWESVRRGEERYIFPYQEGADVMFNSSLFYEGVVLKKYAYDALCAVPKEDPNYTLARRLVKFLNYLADADVEDEIPLNSILREFVGGSCFYR